VVLEPGGLTTTTTAIRHMPPPPAVTFVLRDLHGSSRYHDVLPVAFWMLDDDDDPNVDVDSLFVRNDMIGGASVSSYVRERIKTVEVPSPPALQCRPDNRLCDSCLGH
jgi:hypothetical protein